MKWLSRLFESDDRPQSSYEHPILGIITRDEDGDWNGEFGFKGTKISFTVHGSKAPHEADIGYLLEIADGFERYLSLALEAVASTGVTHSEENDVAARFVPVSLFSIDGGTNRFFYLGLSDLANPEALWRVQFEGDSPTYAGFDS